MNPWASNVRNEKGVALPLALFVLVSLSAFVLAFLSMGAMEPQVSRNLSDLARARYVADAGVEYAFDQVAAASSLNTLLGPPTNGVLANNMPLPGLAPQTFGTFSVTVRNDNQPGDNQITGVAPEPAANVTNDNNNVVIVTATGTYNGVTRTIQVAMSGPWDLPAAFFVNTPGDSPVRSGRFRGNNFLITGNDTNLDGTPGSAPPKPGIGVLNAAQLADANSALAPAPGPPVLPERRDQVQGFGGNPSASPPVQSVGVVNAIPKNLTTQALQALVDQLSASPAQTLTGGTTFTGDLMGPGGTPQVTVVDLSAGSVTISGTGTGKGVLIVKGGATLAELSISGSFQFQGLMIVCCSQVEIGVDIKATTAKVLGGVVTFSSSGHEPHVTMESNGTLNRSVQGMGLARQLMPGGRGAVWSWREL